MTNNEEHLTALQQMRELLGDPKAWIQGSYAKVDSVKGFSTSPMDPEATCFCLAGAARRVWKDQCIGVAGNGPEWWLGTQLIRYTHDSIDRANVPHWNDSPDRTHADVLKFLDSRIEFYKKTPEGDSRV